MSENGTTYRRSVRLKEYDYGLPGDYFVTICVAERRPVLGMLSDDGMRLSAIGELVEAAWLALPERFGHIELDEHILMPNHLHGSISIVDARSMSDESSVLRRPAWLRRPGHGTLGSIVRSFKAASTHVVRQQVLPNFAWQRSYYEHIVRDERELERVRIYIVGNPWDWMRDPENPALIAERRQP